MRTSKYKKACRLVHHKFTCTLQMMMWIIKEYWSADGKIQEGDQELKFKMAPESCSGSFYTHCNSDYSTSTRLLCKQRTFKPAWNVQRTQRLLFRGRRSRLPSCWGWCGGSECRSFNTLHDNMHRNSTRMKQRKGRARRSLESLWAALVKMLTSNNAEQCRRMQSKQKRRVEAMQDSRCYLGICTMCWENEHQVDWI